MEQAAIIREIAEQAGYGDRFFFSGDFKKLTGFTPREFRNRERPGIPCPVRDLGGRLS